MTVVKELHLNPNGFAALNRVLVKDGEIARIFGIPVYVRSEIPDDVILIVGEEIEQRS